MKESVLHILIQFFNLSYIVSLKLGQGHLSNLTSDWLQYVCGKYEVSSTNVY